MTGSKIPSASTRIMRLLSLLSLTSFCHAFVETSIHHNPKLTSFKNNNFHCDPRSTAHLAIQNPLSNNENDFKDFELSVRRRNILLSCGATILTALTSFQQPGYAIPMVTVDEFAIILRDSPLSVTVVEFSGPKSENIVVKLVDGTTFGIKDIIESSTDPRSPLKIAAACRESGVRTKFVDLEAILASTPKKKKLYTNQRVQEAQEKEKERLERIRRDEEQRLAQLAEMEQQQAP
ncbi:hypothetical protein IV203_035984 [Nitzschia inconspicua]|uniref:Uncharacterized protein n=1 Tax=Nitzschia inconspicua TaxID=303405 RepID=A0A9K3LFD3_9STRA|nr:hypothetical protein IV203_035984 [Nitzschia inconspicua]